MYLAMSTGKGWAMGDSTFTFRIVGTPYAVVYRVEAAAVVVLRVLHGAQRWSRA